MEKNKHFEPVTARSLAEEIRKIKINYANEALIGKIQAVLEPHIRKPSDDEWIKKASYLLQKVITSYDNTQHISTSTIREFLNKGTVTADMEWAEENMGAGKTSTLEADIEWLTRGCMRIMHGKTDGDIKAYRELKEFISQKVSPTSPETNSVPERCEEAYNEAVSLLTRIRDKTLEIGNAIEIDRFLKKPNPFKEADIVDDGKPEPQLLPFDLGLAAQGHKVVTRDGFFVKIVADNIESIDHPILYVGTKENGKSFYNRATLSGKTSQYTESHSDLFILKEQETVFIDILRQEDGGLYTCLYKDEGVTYAIEKGTNVIKTITTTI